MYVDVVEVEGVVMEALPLCGQSATVCTSTIEGLLTLILNTFISQSVASKELLVLTLVLHGGSCCKNM